MSKRDDTALAKYARYFQIARNFSGK